MGKERKAKWENGSFEVEFSKLHKIKFLFRFRVHYFSGYNTEKLRHEHEKDKRSVV